MNARAMSETKPRNSSVQVVHKNPLKRKCACGGTPGPTGECEECRRKRLQREIQNPKSEIRNASSVPPIVHEVLCSAGQPLDAQTRAFIEPRVNHDFSRIRVHTDAQATDSAREVKAPAMTGEPGLDNPESTAVMPEQAKDAAPTSAKLPGSPGACVVHTHSAMPYSRSGIIRTPDGKVFENFEVRVEWSSAEHRGEGSYCAAECGEYHQFVKGYARSSPNQDGSGLTDVSAKIFGGKTLDQNVPQEDGLDKNPKARYGHRNETQTMNEKYEPDRATGTKYVGKDSPGVFIGTFADFDLTFVGKLVDTCNNTETVSDPWRVSYRGIIRP